MANKMLFKSNRGKQVPAADMLNEAGGLAYAMPPKQMLAQYAAIGCLNHTFYASAEEQLDTVLKLCRSIEPAFIAKTAVYARSNGYMKDLPALLCAVLTTHAGSAEGQALLRATFDRVIDDARMLRNFVQVVRSGVVGRKSLGSLPKLLVKQWIARRDDAALFRASVGNDPSLADVIRMVHPKPGDDARAALFGYLLGRPHDAALLPEVVRQYEAFKARATDRIPDVPFQMLTSLPLAAADWRQIARHAPWQMTRMNLNTFARHGVFDGDAEVTSIVAERLRNPALIAKAKVFPYQLMVAYAQADQQVPAAVREALQDAMEVAIANVAKVEGGVYVFPDVSGSMHSPVTGFRKGATSAVRCVDVAALVAASMLRQNPDAEVIPFSDSVVPAKLNPRDSVMTNAKALSTLPSGGTNCSAPLRELNRRKAAGDLLIYVSDNESWVDSPRHGYFGGSATATMTEWAAYKRRNPRAKLVCIDIQPYGSTQATERQDVLNIGGFSDRVFDVIAEFANGTLNPDHWVGVIDAVEV